MRKKRTTQYTKNRNRIMRYIRSQRKKGIIIDFDIKTETQLRKEGIEGQKLSALTRELKKIKPKQLKELKIAEFDIETGEIISDYSSEKEGIYTDNTNYIQQIEAEYVSDNEWYNNIVISSWLGTVNEMEYGIGAMILRKWFDKLISDNGKENVVQMLVDGQANGLILDYATIYNADVARNYISEMISYLPDQGNIYKEDMEEYINDAMLLNEYMEENENWEL